MENHQPNPSILKIILIRHAESDENIRFAELRRHFSLKKKGFPKMSFWKALGVFNHKYRNCNLTSNGETVAGHVYQHITKNPFNLIIDQIWHSPLKRTHQTLSKIFPKKIDTFIQKPFLHEKRPFEFLIPVSFNQRVKQFRHSLNDLDLSINCIVVGGHGIFFKKFLGKHYPKLKNVKVILCEYNRNNGDIQSVCNLIDPRKLVAEPSLLEL